VRKIEGYFHLGYYQDLMIIMMHSEALNRRFMKYVKIHKRDKTQRLLRFFLA
jgi:hypothetical protein